MCIGMKSVVLSYKFRRDMKFQFWDSLDATYFSTFFSTYF